MFYITLFLILGVLSFCEYKKVKIKVLTFEVVFFIITIITMIRYGQGTDYFSYMFQYYSTPPITTFSSMFNINTHGEIGFKLMSALFRTFHLSFATFIGVIGLITMALIYKFIKKFSKMPMTTLMLFYVLYYLVYILSGVRQGLALAIFAGIALPYLEEDKYLKFILAVLFAATMHSSVIITLLIIPIKKFNISYKTYGLILIIGILIIVTNIDTKAINLLPEFLSSKILHYWGSDIPIFALANRFVMLVLILYFSLDAKENKEVCFFRDVYVLSFILFILTIKSMTISSRISIYMKFLEVVLIPNMIIILRTKRLKFKAVQLWSASAIITLALLIKTLNAFLGEGDYRNTVNLVEYPYITIFNRADIWKYKIGSRYLDLVKEIGKTEFIKY